ncbi:DHHC palmitoyltransferase-domain-containing protein [Russula aff. rugulosa BPL654]|nr:DHHC palmitoyltransferase-domain-containing protein [Russula aff. rugulosa BPL654]
MKHEKASGYVRNYERISSSNRWFIQGHLLMGGAKPWAFLGSLTLVFSIAGVWLGTTCVWWWHNKSPAVAVVGAYMSLLTVSLMLSTAFKDPGILPRNLDLNPPYPSLAPSDGGDYVPLTRELKVRSAVVTVKYCPTCRTYRPPRSNHCRVCDNCVDGCDHHCQWVNNCVGRRNYTNFFALILVATITLCLVIVTSALHLWMLTSEKRVKNFSHALGKGAGSAVAFCLAVIVVWPVGALLGYHVRLLCLNVTTIEQVWRHSLCHHLAVDASWLSIPITPLCAHVYSFIDVGLALRRFEILPTSQSCQGRHPQTRLHIPTGEEISLMCYVDQVDLLGCKGMPWRRKTSG